MKPAIWESFKRLAPQAQWKNPVMFVCYVGAIITTGLGVQAVVSTGEAPAGYILARLAVALVHGPVRQFRRGDRRRARQGPGGGAAQRAPRHHGEEALGAAARRVQLARQGHGAEGGRYRARRGGRHHPARRRSHRGRGVRQRVGDHGRIGSRDPRGGRRLLLRHRGNAASSRTGSSFASPPGPASRSSTA